jgi:hypothetical protein
MNAAAVPPGRVTLSGARMAEHQRRFGRNQMVYDPWHYVPVLARKPGALRNGAPFKNWVRPPRLEGALGLNPFEHAASPSTGPVHDGSLTPFASMDQASR